MIMDGVTHYENPTQNDDYKPITNVSTEFVKEVAKNAVDVGPLMDIVELLLSQEVPSFTVRFESKEAFMRGIKVFEDRGMTMYYDPSCNDYSITVDKAIDWCGCDWDDKD